MALVLYHNPVSTCSQKVRYVLAEKGLTFESRVIDWSKNEHLSETYLALNPNGVVPTLVDNGRPIVDSSVICEYLDESVPEPPLAGKDALARAEMRAWMRYIEEVPTVAIRVPSFNKVFMKAIKSVPEAAMNANIARMPLRKHFYRQIAQDGFPEHLYRESVEKLDSCLARVEKTVSKQTYLLGEQMTIADITLLPTVVRMEDIGLAEHWAARPGVRRWFAAMQARPAFAVAYYPGSRVTPTR